MDLDTALTKDSSKQDLDYLQVKELYAGYGEFIAIRNISISIRRGEVVSVIGPNGTGKTTLLKTIIGLVKPKRGEI